MIQTERIAVPRFTMRTNPKAPGRAPEWVHEWYEAQPKEWVRECNLCGSPWHVPVSSEDRYGLPQPAEVCGDCGLKFLNPRLTRRGYAEFYERVYRPLLTAYYDRDLGPEALKQFQRYYAATLVWFLGPHDGGKLLDIGGSTGVVADHLCNVFGMTGTVLDPAPEELKLANGLEVIPGFIEDFETDRKWDLITVCQTVDHLLDVSGSLGKIHRLLTPDGVLFLDVADTTRIPRTKVDHPYYLTEQTMETYFRYAGFKVKRKHRLPGDYHVRYLCKPLR